MELQSMPLDSRPAVVADLSASALPPGAGVAPPPPATPTTATEATGRSGNRHYSISRIRHRGYDMLRGEEDDGEGWTTPAYFAHRPGERAIELEHPRFDFTPSQEWFEAQVDRLIARRNAAIDAAARDGLGVMLCFALFGMVALGVAVIA
jgi:hypothetical protein